MGPRGRRRLQPLRQLQSRRRHQPRSRDADAIGIDATGERIVAGCVAGEQRVNDERQIADAHDWIRRVQGDGGYEPMACHDFVQGELRGSLEIGSGPAAAMIVHNQWKGSRHGQGIRACAQG